jgi:uncharacterized membrane protein
MFLLGLYNSQISYGSYSWGYYLIYVMCLIEFFAIYWLESRLGCTDEAVEKFEMLISELKQSEDLL